MSRPELKATAHGDTSAYLLKRTTTELAEDLSKIKDADDFKAESVGFLIHALKQGTAQIIQDDELARPQTSYPRPHGESA